MGPNPDEIALGAGAVWVTNSGDGSLSRIDPSTNEVTTVGGVGGTFHNTVEVAGGRVWVGDHSGLGVVGVDPESLEPLERIYVPGLPFGIVGAFGDLWIAEFTGLQRLLRIGTASADQLDYVELDPDPNLPPDQGATGLLADESRLWVLAHRADAVLEVDPEAMTVVRAVCVGTSVPERLGLSAGSLWIADPIVGAVTRLDRETGDAIARIGLPNDPFWVAGTPDDVWVRTYGVAYRMDVETNTPVARAQAASATGDLAGTSPGDLAVDATTLWIVEPTTNTVARFDLASP